jgi:hypothetical protein
MILEPETMQGIQSGLERVSCQKTCDEWYSSTMYHYVLNKDLSKEISRLIKSWYFMNIKCYSEMYNEKYTDYSAFIKNSFKEISVCQFLKSLHCLHYNIETCYLKMTDQMKTDLKLLNDLIDEITSGIINSLEDYKNATWN